MPTLEQVLERIGGLRRAVILLAGVLLVALILGVSHWATRPTWVPVFTGLPLETIGEVTQRLDEAGIAYRLEQGGGAILVSSDDVARARVGTNSNMPNALIHHRPADELQAKFSMEFAMASALVARRVGLAGPAGRRSRPRSRDRDSSGTLTRACPLPRNFLLAFHEISVLGAVRGVRGNPLHPLGVGQCRSDVAGVAGSGGVAGTVSGQDRAVGCRDSPGGQCGVRVGRVGDPGHALGLEPSVLTERCHQSVAQPRLRLLHESRKRSFDFSGKHGICSLAK